MIEEYRINNDSDPILDGRWYAHVGSNDLSFLMFDAIDWCGYSIYYCEKAKCFYPGSDVMHLFTEVKLLKELIAFIDSDFLKNYPNRSDIRGYDEVRIT